MMIPVSNFAGPICFGPSSQSESFMYVGLIGGAAVFVLAIFVVSFMLVWRSRNTIDSTRNILLRIWVFSLMLFVGACILGYFSASKIGYSYERVTCGYANKTVLGSIAKHLVNIALMTNIPIAVAIILSPVFNRLNKKSKK